MFPPNPAIEEIETCARRLKAQQLEVERQLVAQLEEIDDTNDEIEREQRRLRQIEADYEERSRRYDRAYAALIEAQDRLEQLEEEGKNLGDFIRSEIDKI
ncbi:hypothetical protein L596_025080 [Steinernema carpocapsae]|uniref:Uncharacterized protein n=1 Tax=Steinernema carpocapsae TaxID=34508 RepID=A0A4U5M6R6_STECR|nr:hypothetical protein L596_025080 [Steinernema carpocapsae]